MTKTQLAALGLPEGATDDEIDAKLDQLTKVAQGLLVGQIVLPEGMNRERFEARKQLMIEHSTPPLIAEKFALDAELSQMRRDHLNRGGSKESFDPSRGE